MNYIKSYENYIILNESYNIIGNEDLLNEGIFDIKNYSKYFTLITDLIHKKKPEPTIQLKELLKKISLADIRFKKTLLRFFFITLLVSNPQFNNSINIDNIEKEIINDNTFDINDKTIILNVTKGIKKLGIKVGSYNSYNDFIELKKKQESDNDSTSISFRFKKVKFKENDIIKYKTIKVYGSYIGYFQMGDDELKSVGYGNITRNKFKEDITIFSPKDQIIAYERLLSLNKYFLRNYYKYIGTEVNGIYITESGLLGASSIGIGNLKNFLDSNGSVNKADGNGTTVSYLLKLYQLYDVSNITMMSSSEWKKLRKIN